MWIPSTLGKESIFATFIRSLVSFRFSSREAYYREKQCPRGGKHHLTTIVKGGNERDPGRIGEQAMVCDFHRQCHRKVLYRPGDEESGIIVWIVNVWRKLQSATKAHETAIRRLNGDKVVSEKTAKTNPSLYWRTKEKYEEAQREWNEVYEEVQHALNRFFLEVNGQPMTPEQREERDAAFIQVGRTLPQLRVPEPPMIMRGRRSDNRAPPPAAGGGAHNANNPPPLPGPGAPGNEHPPQPRGGGSAPGRGPLPPASGGDAPPPGDNGDTKSSQVSRKRSRLLERLEELDMPPRRRQRTTIATEFRATQPFPLAPTPTPTPTPSSTPPMPGSSDAPIFVSDDEADTRPIAGPSTATSTSKVEPAPVLEISDDEDEEVFNDSFDDLDSECWFIDDESDDSFFVGNPRIARS
ncbi:hypothetical protein PQX77_022213 [Marasmius sp. AFHP31]|nr:hypothetical protein PQX77_022213 [Marasmius sp. AFHP31]